MVQTDKKPALAGSCKGKNMKAAMHRFWADDDGAVTVDWVVLTAGICMLVVTLFTYLQQSSYEAAASGIRDRVTDAQNIANTP